MCLNIYMHMCVCVPREEQLLPWHADVSHTWTTHPACVRGMVLSVGCPSSSRVFLWPVKAFEPWLPSLPCAAFKSLPCSVEEGP